MMAMVSIPIHLSCSTTSEIKLDEEKARNDDSYEDERSDEAKDDETREDEENDEAKKVEDREDEKAEEKSYIDAKAYIVMRWSAARCNVDVVSDIARVWSANSDDPAAKCNCTETLSHTPGQSASATVSRMRLVCNLCVGVGFDFVFPMKDRENKNIR